jgi:hypothetical protein
MGAEEINREKWRNGEGKGFRQWVTAADMCFPLQLDLQPSVPPFFPALPSDPQHRAP